MRTISFAVAMLVLGGMQAGLMAQDAVSGSTSSFPPPAQGGVVSYRHASTAAEGVLRGWADLTRARGEYNYNTASAALIFEHARRAHLDNKLHYAEVFWAKKQLYESNQAELKRIRLENSVKPRPVAEVADVPVALELPDPSQPGFAWPAAFNRPEFARSRAQLVLLFGQRTPVNSGRGSENHWLLRTATMEARATLADLARQLPPAEHIEARRFLDQVMIAAGQSVDVKVAAN